MRRWMMAGAIALSLFAGPVSAAADQVGDDAALVKAALDALRGGRNADVLVITQPAVARQAVRDKDTGHAWFCSHSLAESIAYALLGPVLKKPVTVLPPDACDALYFRAYALGNLKRLPEARQQLQALTVLAPQYAHYVVELAFATRAAGDQDAALGLYRHAVDLASQAGAVDKANRAASLRGIGFILTEKGDLEGAQASYMDSLKDEPDNALAQNELRYIRKLRAGAGKQPTQIVEHGIAPISNGVGDK